MRALLVVALLAAASPAWSVPTFVAAGTDSQANNTTTTPALPTGHTTNDTDLIIDGFHSAAGTTAASGYTTLRNTVISSGSLTIYGKNDGGSETTPNVTVTGGASGDLHSSVMVTFRGLQTSMASILSASAVNEDTSSNQTLDYPAITIADDDTVVVLAIRWNKDVGSTCVGSTPAGFTALGPYHSSNQNDNTLFVYYRIETTAASIPAGSVTVTGCSLTGTSNAAIIALKMAAAAPSINITDVDTDESITYSQTNVVVTGTGFGASQGAGFMRLIDGAITSNFSIDSWANTSIQGDTAQGNVRFGSRTLRVQENGATNDDQTVTVAVPSGEWYVDITTPVTLNFNALGTVVGRYRMQPNRYYDFPTDLAAGDQLHCKRTGGSGNLTLNPNGTFTADSTVTQIQCRIWHTTWGSYQAWDISGAAPIFVGPNP